MNWRDYDGFESAQARLVDAISDVLERTEKLAPGHKPMMAAAGMNLIDLVRAARKEVSDSVIAERGHRW